MQERTSVVVLLLAIGFFTSTSHAQQEPGVADYDAALKVSQHLKTLVTESLHSSSQAKAQTQIDQESSELYKHLQASAE